MLGGLTMADLYEQLLDSIDTLTPEQLTELASIINAKQPKPEKIKEEISSNTRQPCVHCGSINTKKHGKVSGRQRLYVKTAVSLSIYQQVPSQAIQGFR